MQQASLVGLVKIILIILLVYFGLKIIFKWFGPIILKYFMKKMGEKAFKNFNQATGFQTKDDSRKSEKTIHKKSSNQKKEKKEVGEYIEYEEIE